MLFTVSSECRCRYVESGHNLILHSAPCRYVDERGDLVGLGLEWHAKLLQRVEITGAMVTRP